MDRRHYYLAWPQNATNVNLSPLYTYIAAGQERKVLYHYTSVESLLKIVAPARIKFSRIDRVNDPQEKMPLAYEDFYKAAYIACFNHDEVESIPLWKIYTPKGQGVRVGFFFKGSNIHENLLDLSKTILDSNNKEVEDISLLNKDPNGTVLLMIKDVQYSNNFNYLGCMSFQEGMIDVMPDIIGAYKSTIWEYEKETRMVLYFLNEDKAKEMDCDYLLLPLNTDFLDRIEVRFDPWMSDELKRCLELGLTEYAQKWGIEISFADSDLQNLIK